MKFAVIDIGSNSVRLMLWANGTTLYKRVYTTRLGEGIDSSLLSEAAMQRTVSAVRACCEEGRAEGASLLCFATAAVRSAKNGGSFCSLVERECGIHTDVVSGDEEAMLAVLGALGEEDGAILDIGGASAEYCVREGGKTTFSISLPVGCVRLFDRCGDKKEALIKEISSVLSDVSLPAPGGKLYAVGGTASTLACVRLALPKYDPSRVQNCVLSSEWVGETAEALLHMTAEERRRIVGMDEKRADIIAGGALLMQAIMQACGAREAYFSDRDNLEGYLALRGIL